MALPWNVQWALISQKLIAQLHKEDLNLLDKYFGNFGINADSIKQLINTLDDGFRFTGTNKEIYIAALLDGMTTSPRYDLAELEKLREIFKYALPRLALEADLEKEWEYLVVQLTNEAPINAFSKLHRSFNVEGCQTLMQFFLAYDVLFLSRNGLYYKAKLLEDLSLSPNWDKIPCYLALWNHLRKHQRFEYIYKPSLLKPVKIKKDNDVQYPSAEVKDQETCAVCMDQARTHSGKECGHRCLCQTCASALKACPICRTETSFIKIHL